MFRQWFMCVKTWAKARKTAQSNLAQIDGRHDAEKRLYAMQDELMKMTSEVEQLNKTEDSMRVTAARRIKQLKASKQETQSVIEIVEKCIYSTETDSAAFIEACKHQPNENRIDNIKDAIDSKKLRSVPKCVSVGTDMSDLTGRGKRQRRPHSSLGVRSSGIVNDTATHVDEDAKKQRRRVPELVQLIGTKCRYGAFALTASSDYLIFV